MPGFGKQAPVAEHAATEEIERRVVRTNVEMQTFEERACDPSRRPNEKNRAGREGRLL